MHLKNVFFAAEPDFAGRHDEELTALDDALNNLRNAGDLISCIYTSRNCAITCKVT